MKKHGMKKRVLAALMTACMVVGAVPGVSLADVGTDSAAQGSSGITNPGPNKYMLDGTDYTTGDPDIELNKTAVYNPEDNTYTIKLTAKADEKLTKKETHVVFLLDASGSMNFCEENAEELQIPNWLVLDKTKHIHYYWDGILTGGYKSGCTKVDNDSSTKSRVTIAAEAIAKMKENLSADSNITYSYTWFNDKTGSMDDVSDLQNNLSAKAGTDLKKGVEYALEKFKNDGKDHVLVILADGKSDSSKKILDCNKSHSHAEWKGCYRTVDNYYPKEELEDFRKYKDKDLKVYTIGFTFSSEEFDNLSNGEGYHFNASDETSLKDASEQISQKLKTKIVDNIGENVDLVSGSVSAGGCSVKISDDEKTITWSDLAGLNSEITVSYKVTVNNTDSGSKALNGDAKFNCTYKGKEKSFSFPTPSVDGANLTVKFVAEDNTPVEMEGNWIDWIGLTSNGVKFRNIEEIPNTFTGKDGNTYCLEKIDDPSDITDYSETTKTYTIKSPTEPKSYIVTVTVTPQPETYTVIYDADGGAWNTAFEKAGYTLNAAEGANKLTRSGMESSDKIEILAEGNLPTKEGYIFDGWYLDKDKLIVPISVGFAAAEKADRTVTLKAHWKEAGSQKEYVTYSVRKHYIAPENEYNETLALGQEAVKNSEVSKVISNDTVNQRADEKQTPFGLDYLYDHTTVSYKKADGKYGEPEDYIADETVFSSDCVIDIYYYCDSWKDAKGDGPDSETGGDGIADIKQVLVKFGNKDGNGTVSGTGTVQVFTLDDGNAVTPSETDITKSPANGYKFEKWTRNNSNEEIDPFTEQTGVNGGDTINFWAWFDAEEPEDPTVPTDDELRELISVALVHTGSNADHKDAKYDLIDGSYTVASASDARAIVTVNADAYVKAYNEEYGTHELQGRSFAKLTFKYGGSAWELANGKVPVTFTVKCTDKKPEQPKLPKDDELKKLFGESINVTCITDTDHAAQKFGLISGSYRVARDKDDENTAVVTVRAAKYIEAYLDGKHTNAGDDASNVKLYYDTEDAKWYTENQEISINFLAKCEKKAPEKQYTEIKFIVVNGTFTENGQTEITKTFEVGTKLTVADIPASKGKSSGYSDQTWDKFPVGYVVGENGETFTITYKWRSTGGSSSDSDDSDSDYTSTRGKATNAAGKSGRWILEGGEFTEDNGRLPSNEYLKIGDTIYGFYTYGFAIDFDRPEYYTDAAIQAKGGYRDATGTWRLNGWWFCYDDGTFPHNEWVYLTWNGHSDWYYFDVDGWMEDGWLFWNNNWYYLHTQYDNTRGHMYTGWHEIDGKWYYFNTASDKGTLGAMLANTTTPDGYQVDANGAWIQ